MLEIFSKLEGSGVERYYIGGVYVWGNNSQDRDSGELHNSIKNVAYIFVENATQDEMAAIINESAFYAHVSYHDVSSCSFQENMMAGNIPFGLTHPVVRERTHYRFNEPDQLAEAIASYPFESETHVQDLNNTVEIAKQWSYAAWREQMAAILRLVA